MKKGIKRIGYFLIVLVFGLYLLYANDIFFKWVRLKGEAMPVRVNLPAESNSLKFNVDKVETGKLKWKDVLALRGWVCKKADPKSNRQLFLVLSTPASSQIFEIEDDTVSRPDVHAYLKIDSGISGRGFETAIPLYLLTEERYKMGFLVEDETGRYYMSGKDLIKVAGEYILEDTTTGHIEPLLNPDPAMVAEQASITPEPGNRDIVCNFDSLVRSNRFALVRGWGYLDGLDATKQRPYIILKEENRVFVFDATTELRPDVTSYFKKQHHELDSSGFTCYIPLADLPAGSYHVGLYLVRGKQVGMSYSNHIIKAGK